MPVWHWVTVAFSERRVSSSGIGPADGDPAADHDHVRAVDLHAVVAQQLDDAVRGAGQRPGLVQHQPAEVRRVQAVGVLGRVDQLQHPVGVDALGQRELDDVAGAGRVLVELADRRLDLLLGGGGGQIAADGGDADLGAVAVLARDVPLAAGVVADQQGAQAGLDTLWPSAPPRARSRSDLIAAAVALPSRIWAVMAPSSRMTAPAFQSGPRRWLLARAGRRRSTDRTIGRVARGRRPRSVRPRPSTTARSVEEVPGAGEVHGHAGRSAAASTTSSSRTEPPGCTTALTPASVSTSRPSGNGKKASEAAYAPARALGTGALRPRASPSRPG